MTKYRIITLCVDVMYVNSITFLVTISYNVKFITVGHLQDRTKTSLINGLVMTHSIYIKRGFQIQQVNSDGEFNYLWGKITDKLKADLNVASPDEKVPEIQRCICTIKERTRSIYQSVPFVWMPPILIMEMVFLSVFWLNALPNFNGISNTISPQKLLTGQSIYFNLHCWLEFGQYIQTHEEHNNSMETRTIGAIATCPTGN